MSKDGEFIMVDGIDGAGKSTIINTWVEHLAENKDILDLRSVWQENRFPTQEEINSADVIVSAEPTSIGVGSSIRNDLIQSRTDYPSTSIAQAFALDRLILYNKVILHALNQEKIVLQDRGVSSSLCYQSLQTELSISDIAQLEGNKFVLNYLPDYLIIADVSITNALDRLSLRKNKDNSFFERRKFLKQAKERFLSEKFQNFFQPDANIKILECNEQIKRVKKKALDCLSDILD